MIRRLVWQSLAQRPGRSLLLLVGYGLGVGVTVALLSIGDALVEQSRDRDLLGGGDLIVVPAGIDLETLKTGGVSSLYFTIDQARYLYREVLSGPRFAERIEASSPWIDDELLRLEIGDTTVAVSARGQIPSRASALGVSPVLVAGSWEDTKADRLWLSPSDSARLAEIDAFHLPAGAAAEDSTWAEWHYFNILSPDRSWWLYLTYLVGGDVPDGRWGGQLLANLVRTDGSERRFEGRIESPDIRFHTDRPDLDLGESRVRLTSEGHYRLRARVPAADGRGDSLTLELTLTPDPHRYLPPVDVSPGGFTSGYVVPALGGLAEGRVCLEATCDSLVDAPAYHDHNWGVWRDVTWDWGVARAGDLSLIYGGVRRADATTGGRFLFAVDSLGLKGVLPVRSLEYVWQAGDGSGAPPDGPDGFRLLAHQGRDTVSLAVDVDHVRVTPREADAARFFQMRGIVEVRGTLLGKTVSEEGAGFFETWTTGGERLARAIESRLAETGAEFAVAYRDLESGEEILLRPDLEFHAASMMKVPVMVRLYRMAESGQLSLDASVRVGNVFTSILDGSEYSLSPEDDSDSTLYRRIGSDATVRELLDRMITRSSNLATNLLIEIADPDSIAVLLESVGASGMRVLRGVEDIPAYRAGMNNTTTARGLLELYTALGRGEVAGPVATEEMIDILSEQEFNDAIPAGLPPGIPVAHKTGWITGVDHDGGIVLPPGEPPYVLVILSRGVEDEGVTRQAAADVSRMIWEHRQEGAGGD